MVDRESGRFLEFEGAHKISDPEKLFCPTCKEKFDSRFQFCPYDATKLVNREEDPMAGRVLDDRYQILHALSRGGMGTVYKALHLRTGKPVAIKMILPKFVEDETTLKRFQREVNLQSKLEHPNIVTVIDFSSTPEGSFFFVMEYVEGKSLSRWILENGRLSFPVFFEFACQICDGLEYAHSLKISHRDLKGNNIIISQLHHQRLVKIFDFGLAKAIKYDSTSKSNLTQEGVILGTPAYMSPEQARGEVEKIGPLSDLYSLGVIFFEMLAGKLPFQSDTPWGYVHQHILNPPPPLSEVEPSLPPELTALVNRCLDKDPEMRPVSALEIKGGLEKISSAFDVSAQKTQKLESNFARGTPVSIQPSEEKRSSQTDEKPGVDLTPVLKVSVEGQKDEETEKKKFKKILRATTFIYVLFFILINLNRNLVPLARFLLFLCAVSLIFSLRSVSRNFPRVKTFLKISFFLQTLFMLLSLGGHKEAASAILLLSVPLLFWFYRLIQRCGRF